MPIERPATTADNRSADARAEALPADKCAGFGRAVLAILEEDEDWSGDTFEAIALEAHRRGLTDDNRGEFTVRGG